MNKEFNYTHNKEQRQLNNLNQAANNTSELLIPDFDNFNSFIQTFIMPDISIPKVETPYLGNSTNVVGDTVIYGDLICDLIVDEDLSNYTTLFEWVTLTAHNNKVWDRTVDITILWKNRNLKTLREIVFSNGFLTNIGSITTVYNNLDADIMICPLTFSFEYMIIGDLQFKV